VVTFYIVSALGLLSANPLAELVVATMLPKVLTVIFTSFFSVFRLSVAKF
jgi:hypothetical protein